MIFYSFLPLASLGTSWRGGASWRFPLFTLHKKNELHYDASHPTRPHYTIKCRHSKVIKWCLDQFLPLNPTVLSAARHHERKETFDRHRMGSGFDPLPGRACVVNSIKTWFKWTQQQTGLKGWSSWYLWPTDPLDSGSGSNTTPIQHIKSRASI